MPSLALIAVGGYGRAELHPYSDIDILIKPKSHHASARRNRQPISYFALGFALDIGHAVRSLKEMYAIR